MAYEDLGAIPIGQAPQPSPQSPSPDFSDLGAIPMASPPPPSPQDQAYDVAAQSLQRWNSDPTKYHMSPEEVMQANNILTTKTTG